MNEQLRLKISEHLPLRDVVFQTLRDAILSGELPAGERLMEVQLAEKLGVSRTPVREAIRKLELEGLVKMIPRKGAQVEEITRKDLQDVLEVRCALEELAVELACKNMGEQQIKALKKNIIKFRDAIRRRDITELAQEDVAFHDIIFHATNNERLVQILSHLREQMYRYRVQYLKEEKVHEKLAKEHEEIVKYLEKKQIEQAKQAICSHIYEQTMLLENNAK